MEDDGKHSSFSVFFCFFFSSNFNSIIMYYFRSTPLLYNAGLQMRTCLFFELLVPLCYLIN